MKVETRQVQNGVHIFNSEGNYPLEYPTKWYSGLVEAKTKYLSQKYPLQA